MAGLVSYGDVGLFTFKLCAQMALRVKVECYENI